ncbi:MAG TPA: histidine ammonia-lyase [candidate division Zixibacteria bacterium]
MKTIFIDGEKLTLEQVEEVALKGTQVKISPSAKKKIAKCRRYVEQVLESGKRVYGINTGFGKLCQMMIDKEDIGKLQENLIKGHAIGFGPVFSEAEVRAMMLLRANVLAKGYSGARLELVQRLVDMLNKKVHPVIPEKGSVGASGDLAPLAFIGLVLIGQGWAFYKDRVMDGRLALQKAGIKPIKLLAKEGLALVNGTQVMTAIAILNLLKAERLANLSDVSGAMSLDAILGSPVPFDLDLQNTRRHKGQREVAIHLNRLMKNSQIREFHKACPKIQDPYSFRCMPQVHGAVRDTLKYVRQVLEIEANSATDNPLVFANEDKVISGGNFHGEPVALAMDFLGIAMSELGNIAERRVFAMLDPSISGLPSFLTRRPGLNSGFMIAQTAAAALVSENKILSHPASVDSIPTSINQEDHVSMGTISARKAREIINNVEDILSVEFLVAGQGIDLRKPLKPSPILQKVHNAIRRMVPELGDDRVMMGDLVKTKELVRMNFGMKEL